MKRFILITGLLLLFAAEIARVYFIMPFPGSQKANTIDLAYFLHEYRWPIRIFCLALVFAAIYKRFPRWRTWQKIFFIVGMTLYAVIFYFVNFRFLADKIFYQPKHKNFATAANNKVPVDKLIIGITENGEAKAYPIEIIGYHHQVRDSLGSQPVMVTYCTVCRTGRVFIPAVEGKPETFRLVGMDHFNAMFEDSTTKSWWRQVSGEAIAGPLKGKQLQEFPSQQMRLSAWIEKYPNSSIFQPDKDFQKKYDSLAGFDKGTVKSSLEKRDSGSWKFKSWVVGVSHQHNSVAYDWNDLLKQKTLNDSLPGLPIVIAVEPDSVSFHVFNRTVNSSSLIFQRDSTTNLLTDHLTHSSWDYTGRCIDGPLKGNSLQRVQAYQEFWHSWQTFHPGTRIFKIRE